MPNFDYEELKRALRLIRSVCKSINEECTICPFGSQNGECYLLLNCPDEWRIKEEKQDVVRVMM